MTSAATLGRAVPTTEVGRGGRSHSGVCIQDTLSSRAALGLPAVQPLSRVRRASKGFLHTILASANKFDQKQKFETEVDKLCFNV